MFGFGVPITMVKDILGHSLDAVEALSIYVEKNNKVVEFKSITLLLPT